MRPVSSIPVPPLHHRQGCVPERARARLDAMLAEYTLVGSLIAFRLNALDHRLPVAGAALGVLLGTVAALPPALQGSLLTGMPLSLIWLVRATVNHARSLEDALRRMEHLELAVNRLVGSEAMGFQRGHPSRGVRVGGRTASEAVEAVSAAAALLLAACLYALRTLLDPSNVLVATYAVYIALIAAALLHARHAWARYQYRPRGTHGDRTACMAAAP